MPELSAVPPPCLLPILRSELIALLKTFQRLSFEAKVSKRGAETAIGRPWWGEQRRATMVVNPEFCEPPTWKRSTIDRSANGAKCRIKFESHYLQDWKARSQSKSTEGVAAARWPTQSPMVGDFVASFQTLTAWRDSMSSRDSWLLYRFYCSRLYVHRCDTPKQ